MPLRGNPANRSIFKTIGSRYQEEKNLKRREKGKELINFALHGILISPKNLCKMKYVQAAVFLFEKT